ncbi:MAG: hypothetical protein MHM6MM_000917 [Cercozoa sp. M6MM]
MSSDTSSDTKQENNETEVQRLARTVRANSLVLNSCTGRYDDVEALTALVMHTVDEDSDAWENLREVRWRALPSSPVSQCWHFLCGHLEWATFTCENLSPISA